MTEPSPGRQEFLLVSNTGCAAHLARDEKKKKPSTLTSLSVSSRGHWDSGFDPVATAAVVYIDIAIYLSQSRLAIRVPK